MSIGVTWDLASLSTLHPVPVSVASANSAVYRLNGKDNDAE